MISRQAIISSNQIPEWIRTEYPLFVEFVQAYYDYLDQNTSMRQMHSFKDLDNTLDMFISNFKADFTNNIPDMAKLSQREFIRNAKAFYTSKGSEASFRFLFRAMFGKEVSIYYPEKDMLRASDGNWVQESSFVITATSGNPINAVSQRFTINNQIRKINRVKLLSGNYYEVFFFNTGILTTSIGDTIVCDGIFTGTITPVITKIVVTSPGAGFKLGQVFNINTATGAGAKIRITKVTNTGGILAIKPVVFGYGYADSTYFAQLAPTTNTTTVNTWNNVVDSTLGTVDQGFISTPAVSDEYSTDYEGNILKSFISDNTITVGTSSSDLNVAHIEIRFGSLAIHPGYFATNSGFLSDSIKLQDNYYYQIYSYVLKIDEQLNSYKSLVKSLLHPAGMELFGEYQMTTVVDMSASVNLMDKSVKLVPLDVFYTSDLAVFNTIKALVDSFTMTDSKYLQIYKGLSDSFTMAESGSITKIVPGTYDSYPTEQFFYPPDYYNQPTTTLLYSW